VTGGKSGVGEPKIFRKTLDVRGCFWFIDPLSPFRKGVAAWPSFGLELMKNGDEETGVL